MAVNATEKDAVVGPASIEVLARVAAQTGGADRATAALQKLLSIPYSGPRGPGAPLTPALLRFDPLFDSLRNAFMVCLPPRVSLACSSRSARPPFEDPTPALRFAFPLP